MRANIYSLESLPSETRDAIHGGIGMVATYMGETVVANELTVRLPLTSDGKVNERRVGFAYLDKMVELHVMAVPLLRRKGTELGSAYYGLGVSFIDSSPDAPQVTRTSTAHEVAHSLGFVLDGSGHHDTAASGHHCSNSGCLMQKCINTSERVEFVSDEPKLIQRFLGIRPKRTPIVRTVITDGKIDFCVECKDDLRQQGPSKLNELRRIRLVAGRVSVRPLPL